MASAATTSRDYPVLGQTGVLSQAIGSLRTSGSCGRRGHLANVGVGWIWWDSIGLAQWLASRARGRSSGGGRLAYSPPQSALQRTAGSEGP